MYHQDSPVPTAEPIHEGDGYAFRRSLEEVKERVPLLDYASEHIQLKRVSQDRYTGLCPFHSENTPSFYVYSNDHYHCYGCGAHGDVIDLAYELERCSEQWEAMISLSSRFGFELPRRSERWHKRQDEKTKDWWSLVEVFTRSYQRRLFRVFAAPYLEDVAPELRREEGRKMWADLRTPARTMAIRRMGGG